MMHEEERNGIDWYTKYYELCTNICVLRQK